MRFIHTADNHLDAPLSNLPRNKAQIRREQRLSSFSKIIEHAKNCNMLLISGDLFHTSDPPHRILEYCSAEFQKLGDIPVFISLGNHDFALKDFNFPGNVHIFPDRVERIPYKDALITGISFPSQSSSLFGSIPKADKSFAVNILCMHGDIFSKSDYNPIDKEKLLSYGYDYVALGHVHDYSNYCNIVYPGCHDGAGFDEKGEKGFVRCDISQSIVKSEFIVSSSLIYNEVSFDISRFNSSLEISHAIMESFPQGIYKINLTGTCSPSFDPLCQAIEEYISQKFFYAKVFNKTSPPDFMSESPLCKLFSQYLYDNFDKETAESAIRYGISALKGE